MIRNKLVYRSSYAAIGMICLTKYQMQFKSSDRCYHDLWAIPFNIHTPAMDEMSLINPSEYSFYLRPLGNILFSLSTPRKI